MHLTPAILAILIVTVAAEPAAVASSLGAEFQDQMAVIESTKLAFATCEWPVLKAPADRPTLRAALTKIRMEPAPSDETLAQIVESNAPRAYQASLLQALKSCKLMRSASSTSSSSYPTFVIFYSPVESSTPLLSLPRLDRSCIEAQSAYPGLTPAHRGTVKMRLVVNGAGRIEEAVILSPSGSEVVDQQALQAVAACPARPAIAANGQSVSMETRFDYILLSPR